MSFLRLPPDGQEFFSGDSKQITFNVEGVPSLTGYAISFTLFSELPVTKTQASGVTIAATAFTVTFNPPDTDALAGSYSYEAQGTSPTGEIVTLAHGILRIKPDRI